MKEIELKGCGTALITPFDNGHEVDYAAFKNLVRRQIEAGIHFLVPLGTTGETPCLENDEKIKLLEIIVEEVNGKIPIVAGAGSNNTKAVIKNIKSFEKIGVDCFLIVAPYYNKPTQAGLFNHFKAVAEATDKPIVMYNVPGRTGINIAAETCLKLAEIKNIIATKEASGNQAQISEIIKNAPAGFTVLSGNDDETLTIFSLGGRGIISVASNIAPKETTEFLNFLLAGDFISARKMHHHLMPLFKNCFVESNPIPVKAGMCEMGLIKNVLRLPLCPAAKSTVEIMKKTISDLKIR